MTAKNTVEITREWEMLESVCLEFVGLDNGETYRDLIRSRQLDWGVVLRQGLRHKTLALLGHALASKEWEQYVPESVLDHLQDVLDWNRIRISGYRREMARVALGLRERGVAFVATKGISFESTVYRETGIRCLGDIDLMVTPSTRESMHAAMTELGYLPGRFSWYESQIVPLSRKEAVRYKMSPDHLEPYVRIVDAAGLKSVRVDVANSLTWDNSPYHVPVEDAMEGRQEQLIPGHDEKIAVFPPAYQMIFTILHLFREVWFDTEVDAERDVTLMKYLDVIALWHFHKEAVDPATLRDILERTSTVDPVLWVLQHTDATFRTDLVQQWGLTNHQCAVESNERAGRGAAFWSGTMRERLASPNRRLLFFEKQSTSE